MPRPRVLGDEPVVMQIRMSASLKEQIRLAAMSARRTPSDWIRVVCEDALMQPPPKPKRR